MKDTFINDLLILDKLNKRYHINTTTTSDVQKEYSAAEKKFIHKFISLKRNSPVYKLMTSYASQFAPDAPECQILRSVDRYVSIQNQAELSDQSTRRDYVESAEGYPIRGIYFDMAQAFKAYFEAISKLNGIELVLQVVSFMQLLNEIWNGGDYYFDDTEPNHFIQFLALVKCSELTAFLQNANGCEYAQRITKSQMPTKFSEDIPQYNFMAKNQHEVIYSSLFNSVMSACSDLNETGNIHTFIMLLSAVIHFICDDKVRVTPEKPEDIIASTARLFDLLEKLMHYWNISDFSSEENA